MSVERREVCWGDMGVRVRRERHGGGWVCVCVETGMGLGVGRVGYFWKKRCVSERTDRDGEVSRS